MKKQSIMVTRERLKQVLMANCRSDIPSRWVGMERLAKKVGVFSSPSTLELDLLAYVDQLKNNRIQRLFEWARDVSRTEGAPDLIPALPKFQLELI